MTALFSLTTLFSTVCLCSLTTLGDQRRTRASAWVLKPVVISPARKETFPSRFATALDVSSSTASNNQGNEIEEQERPKVFAIEFTKEEIETIEKLIPKKETTTTTTAGDNNEDLKKSILEALPNLPPKLVVKLRQAENDTHESVRLVATELNRVLDERLEQAKTTLEELLNAGEIRKLDALIGKAARSGNLDVAFFNVLSMNMQVAAREENVFVDDNLQDGETEAEAVVVQNPEAASRLQILQHVYTRCQEEVEKTIPPAMALLNKLLRTQQPPIRRNLYQHYLTPQPTVIKTPDGKEIELAGSTQPVLVSLTDFVDAIAKAVEQIRTVEQAGGTDRESAANMVESCRQVAKEARIVVGEGYGTTSKELKSFEEGLQPVFRPTSPDSPYIKGQQA